MGGSRSRTQDIAHMLTDSRRRTLELISDLDDDGMMGPELRIVNPPLWEIGHLAWFQEHWNLLRMTDDTFAPSPLLENTDELYDSMEVHHDTRWSLPLLSRRDTISYMRRVLERTLEKIENAETPSEADVYFARLAAFHEDMHGEAFTYTRNTHALPKPPISDADPSILEGMPTGPCPGDAEIPGGTFMLGAPLNPSTFVFDNEKWEHPVEVEPFRFALAPTTNEEYAAFVDDGGYEKKELWSEAGWEWRESAGADHPVYWRKDGGEWNIRHFDETRPMRPHAPVIHVNFHEADAYCRWAGRRLPTEAEWEYAASADPDGGAKRLYPWGDEPPTAKHANLDGRLLGVADVAAFPEGDGAYGLRQMMGNVWEWCADDFGPYPGFVADPYKDYSEPWFGNHKIMRGGSWATRGRMLRNTWRNFGTPDRRDILAGFRTCAV